MPDATMYIAKQGRISLQKHSPVRLGFDWFAGTRPIRIPVSVLGVLLTLLAIALLAPIWTVRYPLVRDYPNHLASAFVLAHLTDPAFQFNQFYASHWSTYPYLTMDLILVGLQRFVPVDVAGRLFLSLCALALPASGWLFVREANPGEESLALWSLLVSNSVYLFLCGLLNMQLSLALCLVVLVVWLRYVKGPTVLLWCFLLLLTTALYFTHLIGFLLSVVIITAYCIARRCFREIAISWLLYIPGAIFLLHSTAFAVVSHGSFRWPGVVAKMKAILALVLSYSPAVDFVTLLVIGGSVALACWGNPELRWNSCWLGVATTVFALYWLCPADDSPHSYTLHTLLDVRLIPMVFLLFLATFRLGRRRRALATIALLLFLVRAGALEIESLTMQSHYSEMSQSFSHIPQGARVLPLVGSEFPTAHFSAYGVIQRGWFSPCLFHEPGVYPLTIRHLNDRPETWIHSPCEEVPSLQEWSRVQRDVEYVWAYKVRNLSTSLSKIATLIYNGGDVQVFRINPRSRTLMIQNAKVVQAKLE